MTASQNNDGKRPILDRLERIFKLSGSAYAFLAAVAAVIIANQSEARRTRFTIYVISQMWIECLLALSFWFVFVLVRGWYRRLAIPTVRMMNLVRGRTLVLLLINASALLMLLPPLVYIAKIRYEFWTTSVLRSYVESAKRKIDQEARVGALDTAHSTADSISDFFLKNTGQEHRLDYRDRVLGAAIDRSQVLDKTSMVQWNFVTERPKFFSLVEAVRIDPENSSAADRLGDKLNTLKEYVAQDAHAICGSQGSLAQFSGKVVALVEARSIWEQYGSSEHCNESVNMELSDAFGLRDIACILAQNNALKHGDEKSQLDPKNCPEGEDFWTPLPSKESEGESEPSADVYPHPFYPTIVDLWRKLKKQNASDRLLHR